MDETVRLLENLLKGRDLIQAEAVFCMEQMLSGNLPEAQVAALLTALRAKGETADELIGFVLAMRRAMRRIHLPGEVIVDTCGTGGDGKGTFNISTAAAFIVAAAGVKVAKHGNRSVSSLCGSADVLLELGVKVDMPQDIAERCLKQAGITFLFAPLYHPAMKAVALIRKDLGVRTVFNILGPLVNPAGAEVQVIGVAEPGLLKKLSGVLKKLYTIDRRGSAVLVHEQGYDELVLRAKADLFFVGPGRVTKKRVNAKALGLSRSSSAALAGQGSKENAQVMRAVLSGQKHPLSEVLCANAALALYAASIPLQKTNPGLADKFSSLPKAVQCAQVTLASGSALVKLGDLIDCSRSQ